MYQSPFDQASYGKAKPQKKAKKRVKKKAKKAPARKKAKKAPARKKAKKAPARKKASARKKACSRCSEFRACDACGAALAKSRPQAILLGPPSMGGEGYDLVLATARRGLRRPKVDCGKRHKDPVCRTPCAHPLPEGVRKKLPSARQIIDKVTWTRRDIDPSTGEVRKERRRRKAPPGVRESVKAMLKDAKQWDRLVSRSPSRDPGLKGAIDGYVTGKQNRGKWLRDFIASTHSHLVSSLESLNNSFGNDWRKCLPRRR
jgi:hypothetical protein